jgi:hypothetical protein
LPVKDFCHGIFHGLTGIIADPYYGAKKGTGHSMDDVIYRTEG